MTASQTRALVAAARVGWRLFQACTFWCNRLNAVAERLAALAGRPLPR